MQRRHGVRHAQFDTPGDETWEYQLQRYQWHRERWQQPRDQKYIKQARPGAVISAKLVLQSY